MPTVVYVGCYVYFVNLIVDLFGRGCPGNGILNLSKKKISAKKQNTCDEHFFHDKSINWQIYLLLISNSRKFNQNLTGLKAIARLIICQRKEFCVFMLMFNFWLYFARCKTVNDFIRSGR